MTSPVGPPRRLRLGRVIALLTVLVVAGCGASKPPATDSGADARDADGPTTPEVGPTDMAPSDADAGDASGGDGDASTDADGPPGPRFKAVAVSTTASCAITTDGKAYCWGSGGALGVSTPTSMSVVPVAVETTETFDAIGLGDGVGCGLNHAGAAFCWGFNSVGSVGDGTKDSHRTPVAVTGGHTFTSLSVGHYTACATTADGAIYCWGSNSHGALGDGSGMDQARPSKVASALTFGQVSTSGDHTCALTKDGAAYCWGGDSLGALGDGAKNDSPTPIPVVGGLSFKSIAAAETTKTCALTADGAAYCWGIQANGALGNGVVDNVLAHALDMPVPVSGTSRYTSIAGDVFTTCAVTATGGAACWGFGLDGNLGDGQMTMNRAVPGPVATDLPIAAVALSSWENSHACALTTTGLVLCWGNNSGGDLGDGTQVSRPTPAPIDAPGAP